MKLKSKNYFYFTDFFAKIYSVLTQVRKTPPLRSHYLAATAAYDTARNSDAGNDENNSNPKVEIFIGSLSLLVSIFFTFANRGGQ